MVVFIMITANKIKASGLLGYMKGFTTPIPVMTPFNILSEIATPISMACRHFGNILSGVVINGLLYAALAVASSALLGWLPGALGEILGNIPILDVGIPAILSVYFDWFFRLYAGIHIQYADHYVHCKRGRRLSSPRFTENIYFEEGKLS